jgi:hypothetical protein
VVADGEGDRPRRRAGAGLERHRSRGDQSGDIIGSGEYHGGLYAFLLRPVSAFAAPEPSTWPMLLIGFAGLGFAGYRRAKKGHATVAA